MISDRLPASPTGRLLLFAGVFVCVLGGLLLLTREPRTQPDAKACATDARAGRSPIFDAEVTDAALLRMDRAPVMLRDLAGRRLTVLLFCSYRCPCSDGYGKRLQSLRAGYESRGVSFAAIHASADETIDGMKSYVNRRHFPLAVYRDENGIVADMLHASVTPEAFVFTPDWKLRYHGRIDDDKSGLFITDRSLQQALDTLLAGGQLAVREKLSLGCGIVRNRQTAAR